MESPLRYISSDEYSSSWLKFHLGLPRQSSQRTKHPNPQQHRKQQPQHLNTLGLRLNAAGNIKPTVVHMPSLENRWKIHYSYKTKVLARSISDDAVDPPASQRSTRDWPRSESGKRPPHDVEKERTRARSAASATLARGREQRSPRIRAGTPELVTTTPIRLLGVLRSPEHALNWRVNDGQQPSPKYFTFPPVTGSRAGATSLVRPERRGQVSTGPVESRVRSEPQKEDLMTLSRSSSSESLPSAWKYADGRQANATTGSNEVTDEPTPRMTADPSNDTSDLPTIDEEDATASETNHSISVRISRNNNSNNNRYNNYYDNDNYQRPAESDELRRRRVYNDADEDSDSLSVYDDDSEDADEEEWTREPIPSSVLAIPQTQRMDNEDIKESQNEDHNEDQNEDHNGTQIGDRNEDRNEDHNVEQNKDHNRDQNEDHNVTKIGAQNDDQNEDHSVKQNEDHSEDQDEDHSGHQNADPKGDLNEDQNWDQPEYLSGNEKKDPRECSADDYQEMETWTKDAIDFSPTQRPVYPPLTSRDRDSDSPLIPRDIPTANESHKTTESMDVTDEQNNAMKVLDELRPIQEAGEVENSKEISVHDIGNQEEFCEGQDVSDKGDSSRDTEQRVESDKEMVECNILTETIDENNNVFGTQDQNDATKGNGETRENSNNTDVEDSTQSVESDIHESPEGNVDIDSHRADANESKTSEAVEPLVVISTELIHSTDSQSDLDSKLHLSITDLDDCGQQNGASPEEPCFTDEKLDSFSEESVSLESTIASQAERRSPLTGKAARKRSVRFSQDVATVYLYLAATPTDDSETSDSGFLSP